MAALHTSSSPGLSRPNSAVVDRRHARRRDERGLAAFQHRELLLDGLHARIRVARVDVLVVPALLIRLELGGILEDERAGGVDGRRQRRGVGARALADVDGVS